MTRQKLIDYLESFHPSQWPHSSEIADALIKEGFVKIDEPREFWICSICNYASLQIEVVHMCQPSQEIIHVREVIDERS